MSKAKFIEASNGMSNGKLIVLNTNYNTWYCLWNRLTTFETVSTIIRVNNKTKKQIKKVFTDSNEFFNAIDNIVKNKNILIQ
jgi:hypothetical protein